MKKTTQEQKECLDSDHLNHKDCPTKRQWGLEAARAANKAQAKLVKNYNAQCRRCNLGEPKEFHGCEPYPQPTDGLIDWEKDLESFFVAYSCYYSNSTPKTYEFNQKNKEKVKKQASNFIRQLLTEQRLNTREDTLNHIEAIWTRLMNETDDSVYKEIYARCIKSLKT